MVSLHPLISQERLSLKRQAFIEFLLNFGFDIPTSPTKMPPLLVKNLDGAVWNLGEAKGGELSLINLFSLNCLPCRGEVKALKIFYEQSKKAKINFSSIALGDAAEDLQNYIRSQQITYPVYMDGSRDLNRSRSLGAGLPRALIIDGDGELIAFGRGPFDWAAYDFIEAVLRYAGN